jgi:hypothetical protein
MHEELENFERIQVWELVEPPPNYKPIGTKWVWKTKRDKMVRWQGTSRGWLLRAIVRRRG